MKYIISLILLSWSLAFADNPDPEGGTLKAVDSSNAAGTRTAESGQKLLMVSNGSDRSATITATPKKDPQEQGFPKWSGNGLNNPTNGSLTADFKSQSNSSIKAEFSPRGEATIDIEVHPKINVPKITVIDGEKATVKKSIEQFNKYIDKLGYTAGISLSGKVEGGVSSVDYYDNGQKIGIKIKIAGEATLTLGKLSVSVEVPTNVPGIKLTGSASLDLQSLKVEASGEYDESKANKWVNDLKGGLTLRAGVSVTAGLAIGLPAGADVVTLEFKGETSISGTGTLKLQNKNIMLGTSVAGAPLKVTAEAKWVLVGEYSLGKGEKTFGQSIDETFPDAVVYTIPDQA